MRSISVKLLLVSHMSHQKIKCQILQCNVCEMKIRYSYREITDNNAYSIYNKQKFVCKMFSTTYTKKKRKIIILL